MGRAGLNIFQGSTRLGRNAETYQWLNVPSLFPSLFLVTQTSLEHPQVTTTPGTARTETRETQKTHADRVHVVVFMNVHPVPNPTRCNFKR